MTVAGTDLLGTVALFGSHGYESPWLGSLRQAEMWQVRTAPADREMIRHHEAAVTMADRMWHSRGDPRLCIMAHAIRHAQQAEIALMRGVSPFATCWATASIRRQELRPDVSIDVCSSLPLTIR